MSFRTGAMLILTVALASAPAAASAETARNLYARALSRERAVRTGERPGTVQQIRGAIAAYERVVRQFPTSGYCDNALWQAGNLALLAYERFGQAADRQTARRLFALLKSGYPSSSLGSKVDDVTEAAPLRRVASAPAASSTKAPAARATEAQPDAPITSADLPEPPQTRQPERPIPGLVTIREITRTPLPDGVRVSIRMDGELLFHHERLDNPRRVFFDLMRSRPAPGLLETTLRFDDDVVKEIRLGRHPQDTTRVVMDMDGADSYSVFALYNPYRLVVDFRRSAPAAPVPLAPIDTRRTPLTPPAVSSVGRPTVPEPKAVATTAVVVEKPPLPSREAAPPALSAPAIPAANSNGQFSIARQLGLGIARVVIDPGHGGHDPGARANGINEAELVLDVASRLRKLLEKQPGTDVVMTRDSDVFIPLEQRTAIANREGADLFLSIHANASRNVKARGIETYFLNFASNPEAEAVAARENSTSGRAMHSLPEIVRAIALNNKIDESRDFADTVQKAMVRKLSTDNALLKDLGVKQAPFVVLIGAGMPSVLAEISFVTNRQEGQLLKTSAYRQQIAEALFDAIVKYQRALKVRNTIATREDSDQ